MQIRIQGQTVQLIRAPYDPGKKRCVPVIVARVPLSSANNIADDMLAGLTENEIKQVLAWADARQAAATDQAAQASVDGMASSIRGLAGHVGRLTDGQAAGVYQAIAELTLALRRAGHTRPKADPAPGVVAPGQMSLTE